MSFGNKQFDQAYDRWKTREPDDYNEEEYTELAEEHEADNERKNLKEQTRRV